MPDDTKDIYPDETVNPMPDAEGSKIVLTVLNIIIACTSIADMICYFIFFRQPKKVGSASNDPDDTIQPYDISSLVCTLVDFAFSLIAGYGIYSPMDTSNKKIKDTNYGKLIEAASEACGKYTTVWFIKTAVSLFIPVLNMITLTKGFKNKFPLKDETKNKIKALKYSNDAFNGILALSSAVLEIIACTETSNVKGVQLTDDQKKDKQYFLSDTIGFICDDARVFADSIVSLINTENPLSLIPRELFALAYCAAKLAEIEIIW